MLPGKRQPNECEQTLPRNRDPYSGVAAARERDSWQTLPEVVRCYPPQQNFARGADRSSSPGPKRNPSRRRKAAPEERVSPARRGPDAAQEFWQLEAEWRPWGPDRPSLPRFPRSHAPSRALPPPPPRPLPP